MMHLSFLTIVRQRLTRPRPSPRVTDRDESFVSTDAHSGRSKYGADKTSFGGDSSTFGVTSSFGDRSSARENVSTRFGHQDPDRLEPDNLEFYALTFVNDNHFATFEVSSPGRAVLCYL